MLKNCYECHCEINKDNKSKQKVSPFSMTKVKGRSWCQECWNKLYRESYRFIEKKNDGEPE